MKNAGAINRLDSETRLRLVRQLADALIRYRDALRGEIRKLDDISQTNGV